MTQQYGFRATNNLSEVLDRDKCWDNLGIDRRDLALLVGTSANGVTEGDYQSIIALKAPLEGQIVSVSGLASLKFTQINSVATTTGSTFAGNIISDAVNNDRPYVTFANAILGPSTASFFSPIVSGNFIAGGEYKLGPVGAATTTSSGFNYTGQTKDWNDYFVAYKNYLYLQEQPSWTTRKSPLYLPPPIAIDNCVMWLDSEYSPITLDASSGVTEWKGVEGQSIVFQSSSASRPVYVENILNGKPAIRFDGVNDFLEMGDLGASFPNGATLVCKVRIEDNDYNIFGTLNSSSNRWNDSTGQGSLGMFTTTVQTYSGSIGFPNEIDSNGTMVFSVRVSQSYGIDMRENNRSIAFKQPSTFTYTGGNSFFIGKSGGASGYFKGDIYSFALFARVLTDKEVRSIEEYFAWRYDAIYDPDRTQQLQLEDFSSIDLENGTPITA